MGRGQKRNNTAGKEQKTVVRATKDDKSKTGVRFDSVSDIRANSRKRTR